MVESGRECVCGVGWGGVGWGGVRGGVLWLLEREDERIGEVVVIDNTG